MKKLVLVSIFLTLAATSAFAKGEPAKLDVKLSGIKDGGVIPDHFAYCVSDGQGGYKKEGGGNTNPKISWSKGPKGTKSYALAVVDRDVPSDFSKHNKKDATIGENDPRQDFYHWVLANIPATATSLAEGVDSKGITEGGKAVGRAAYGLNGQNDYGAKAKMGQGGGYDGPCPPWNDERVHHYHFIVYALDIPELKVQGAFNGSELENAMQGHILAQGESVGTFTTNPKLLKK